MTQKTRTFEGSPDGPSKTNWEEKGGSGRGKAGAGKGRVERGHDETTPCRGNHSNQGQGQTVINTQRARPTEAGGGIGVDMTPRLSEDPRIKEEERFIKRAYGQKNSGEEGGQSRTQWDRETLRGGQVMG